MNPGAESTTNCEQVDFRSMLFPGRRSLYVSEVAKELGVTDQHIIDLIEEGQIGAVNVGGGKRNYWRIPVSEFEKFLKSRISMSQTFGSPTKNRRAGAA